MWVQGYEFEMANDFLPPPPPPHLILICLCGWSGRCCTNTVSALIVCACDPSRHCALLLFVSARWLPGDEWQRMTQILRKPLSALSATTVDQRWSSEVIHHSSIQISECENGGRGARGGCVCVCGSGGGRGGGRLSLFHSFDTISKT